MFLGQYHHNLDNKGRLTVPARYRDQLSEDGCFLMMGFDINLMLLTPSLFEVLNSRVNQMSLTDSKTRSLRRLLYSSAQQFELDKAGRILLPQFLREAANIDDAVYVVGAGQFIEIWSPDLWSGQSALFDELKGNPDLFADLNLATG